MLAKRGTVVPTKSNSEEIFCLQLLSKKKTNLYTPLELMRINRSLVITRHFKKCWVLCLYPATLKRAGYYVIPFIQKIAFECPSVCPSAHHFHSLLGAFFNQTCYEG